MLTLALAAAALQPVHAPALEVTRDPITDRFSAFAIIHSPEGRLEIGCDPQEFRGVRVIAHSSRAWLARERFVSRARSFTFRFDAGTPLRSRWSTRRSDAWLQSHQATSAFIERAREANLVVIRAMDMEGRRLDLAFDLAGTRPLIEEVLGICSGAVVPTMMPRP